MKAVTLYDLKMIGEQWELLFTQKEAGDVL